MEIIKPTLILDEVRTKANILKMAEKAKENKLKFRPHFKTHQSRQVGQWFKEVGVNSITVSSLDMAEYFANIGWAEITVAFPCNILQIDLINVLAHKVNLTLLVDHLEVVNKLNGLLKNQVEIYIEIDTGTHRTGVLWNDLKTIEAIVKTIINGSHTNFKGFYCHSGNSYNARGKSEIVKVYEESINRLAELKELTSAKFDYHEFCYGDTPACSIATDFENVDAISPGNFTFYDIMQQQIGSCYYDEISVAMACPVVSINHKRGEVCIYGGAIHFSKDFILENGHKVFGKLVEFDGQKWGEPIGDCYIKSLSQEHGLVHINPEKLREIKIGDILYFLPVHSCLTAECMKGYLTTQGKFIEHY